jgi:hypothetical protein
MRKSFVSVKNVSYYIVAVCLMVYFFALAGCAANKLYSVEIHYDSGKAIIPSYLKADDKGSKSIIAVAEFIDARQSSDNVIVGRVVEKGGASNLIFPKYTAPTKAIADGIKEYLFKAGYKVAGKIPPWDLKEETMPKDRGKVLIGGRIDELDITCRKGSPSDTYKANIKLTIFFADPEKGIITYKGTVESSSSKENVFFSEDRLEQQINISLTEAIERGFEDRRIAQAIKDIIAQ